MTIDTAVREWGLGERARWQRNNESMRHESMEAHSIWQWKDKEKWDSSLKRVGSYGGLFQNKRGLSI